MPTPITLHPGPLLDTEADSLALLIPSGDEERAAALAPVAEATGLDLEAALASVDVSGKVGQVARIPVPDGQGGARLLIVVGSGEDADHEGQRRAAATAVRSVAKDSSVAIAVPKGASGPVAEGAGLGAYAYTTYRKKPHEAPTVTGITLVSTEVDAQAAIDRATAVVDAVCAARDMVNTPPADKRPPALAEHMAELVEGRGVEVKIFDVSQLEEGGYGGILGVGAGSSAEPRLVELTYAPEGAAGHVIIVGKGITFDSGGLSLKPWKSMLTMKSDMAGAAAVAATMRALQALKVKTKVTALCALAENMPSGTATRPSDVLTHRNGKTVEVLNTDAEGRLVLADALSYACEQDPDVVIDLATLTGAQVVSLGEDVAAVLSSDDGLRADLESAADAAGEQIWPLPLVERYRETLKSPVADLKNIGKPGHAGTITAALFLQEFTDGRPWAHLDIAGPAFMEAANESYLSAGGTGFGVRTLLSYLTRR